jgi:choline dehydrogenase-like flavoprotein
VAVGGLFDRPVNMRVGATQGAESVALRAVERFKPETLSMQPEVALVRVPGVGRALTERLSSFPNVAMWVVQVRARAEGVVRPGWAAWSGKDRVSYSLGEDDMQLVRRGVLALARSMFAAGAREVWPGVHGIPPVLRSEDDLRRLEDASLDPRAYTFIASHLFGTARMAKDRRAGVVDTDFTVHGAEGLHVVDSSLFPTNLGVNPQHGIMALARLAAASIVEGRTTAS